MEMTHLGKKKNVENYYLRQNQRGDLMVKVKIHRLEKREVGGNEFLKKKR